MTSSTNRRYYSELEHSIDYREHQHTKNNYRGTIGHVRQHSTSEIAYSSLIINWERFVKFTISNVIFSVQKGKSLS
jgi:hypothetical protein